MIDANLDQIISFTNLKKVNLKNHSTTESILTIRVELNTAS